MDNSDSESSPIEFFSADIEFELDDSVQIANWLQRLVKAENCGIDKLQYVFSSDDYILDINKQYLNHDYYTDIITFPLNASKAAIQSDIYISIDRVRDNAKTYDVQFDQELYRVIAHGLLHLCGYGDATEAEKNLMRQKEDYYLNLIFMK